MVIDFKPIEYKTSYCGCHTVNDAHQAVLGRALMHGRTAKKRPVRTAGVKFMPYWLPGVIPGTPRTDTPISRRKHVTLGFRGDVLVINTTARNRAKRARKAQ